MTKASSGPTQIDVPISASMPLDELNRAKVALECQRLQQEITKNGSVASSDTLLQVILKQAKENILTWCIAISVAFFPIVAPKIAQQIQGAVNQTNQRLSQFERISTEISDLRWMYQVMHHRCAGDAPQKLFSDSPPEWFKQDVSDFNKALDTWERRKAINRANVAVYFSSEAVKQFDELTRRMATCQKAFLNTQRAIQHNAQNAKQLTAEFGESIEMVETNAAAFFSVLSEGL